jgi:hypothetical protein
MHPPDYMSDTDGYVEPPQPMRRMNVRLLIQGQSVLRDSLWIPPAAVTAELYNQASEAASAQLDAAGALAIRPSRAAAKRTRFDLPESADDDEQLTVSDALRLLKPAVAPGQQYETPPNLPATTPEAEIQEAHEAIARDVDQVCCVVSLLKSLLIGSSAGARSFDDAPRGLLLALHCTSA